MNDFRRERFGERLRRNRAYRWSTEKHRKRSRRKLFQMAVILVLLIALAAFSYLLFTSAIQNGDEGQPEAPLERTE